MTMNKEMTADVPTTEEKKPAALIAIVAIRLLVLLLHDIPFGRSVAETFAQDVPSTSLRAHWSFGMLRQTCRRRGQLPGAVTSFEVQTNNRTGPFLLSPHGY